MTPEKRPPEEKRRLVVLRAVELLGQYVHGSPVVGVRVAAAACRVLTEHVAEQQRAAGIVHRAIDGGVGPFNCCGLHCDQVPVLDRITWSDDLVTCEGG